MRCTVIYNKTCRYSYNFMYKIMLVEATTYPKFKVITSILLEKMNNVKFTNIVKFLLYHTILVI